VIRCCNRTGNRTLTSDAGALNHWLCSRALHTAMFGKHEPIAVTVNQKVHAYAYEIGMQTKSSNVSNIV